MIDFPSVQVLPLQVVHWPQVRDIYAAGIATGYATFEPEPPSWAAFNASKLPAQRLVAVDSSGAVLGWAAASAVSDRSVYAGVVEHSVYVDSAVQSRGIGLALLGGLATSTEAAGIWIIQAGIFPENTASLRLHEKAGFRIVGTRQRFGKMTYGSLAGRWRDVIMIERRSSITGRD